MDSAYYALIFNFLTHRIERFAIDTMGRAIDGVTSVAFILVTLWVFIRGYAMVTGQLRAPMMDRVARLIKIALIVTAAKAMSFGGTDLYNVLYKQLPREVNRIMAGSDASPVQQIDKNLLLISAATSAIDMVQVPSGDIALADAKAQTTMMATFGIGAPAMAAGAMLLLYQLSIALIVGLAPLFILCLAFDHTKDLFRRWLMYAIGTVFSMATLNWVSSIALDLTTRVAAALWTTDALSRMTGLDAQGFSTMAFQQGGVGLLMTVLIISTPPMAAMLFGGVLGNFNPFPGFGSAGSGRSRRAPGGGETPAPHYQPSAPPSHAATAPLFPHRLTGMASSAQADVIKPVDPSRTFASLDDIAMARAAYGDPKFWTAQVGPPAPGTGVLPPSTQTGLDDRVIDSILDSEGSAGEQGGRAEVYGFRQGNGPAYDEIVAARQQYGQGSAEERAVATRYLTDAAQRAGALNFTDPGKQAAVMSMAHMRGVGGAQAILNSVTSGQIERAGRLNDDSIRALESMPSEEFQSRVQDARTNYDRSIYGETTTTVRGVAYNWWDRFGPGLQSRYAREARAFGDLSHDNPQN